MCGVDHLRVCGSSISGKLPEQVFPDATPSPTREAVVDRRRRAIGFRAIGPAASAFQHMHNPADDASIVLSLLATNLRWQMWFNAFPLFIA
jgi:hypothetical protein